MGFVTTHHRLKIVDLTPRNADDCINLCIGSKPGFEMAREEKRRWLEARFPYAVGGKLAYYDSQLAGMIEYSPIEYAPFPIAGEELLHINCIWVLPNFQRKGIGSALLKSCIQEIQARDRKGLSVLAQDGTFFMPSTFFLRQGFMTLRRRGGQELMWKRIAPCRPPRFLPVSYSPSRDNKRVLVEMLYCAQCPWSIITQERLRRVSKEFDDSVRIRLVRTDDRRTVEKLGEANRIFVDGKEGFFAPPTEDDIRKVLAEHLKNLEREIRMGFRP